MTPKQEILAEMLKKMTIEEKLKYPEPITKSNT